MFTHRSRMSCLWSVWWVGVWTRTPGSSITSSTSPHPARWWIASLFEVMTPRKRSGFRVWGFRVGDLPSASQ